MGRALSHCAGYLTDGTSSALRPRESPARRSEQTAWPRLFVGVGLWELHPSGDGWQVHDYLAFNSSKVEVLAERESKRQAGKLGAAKRWQPMAPAMAPAIGAAKSLPSEAGMLPSIPYPSHPEKRMRLSARSPDGQPPMRRSM